MRRLGVFDIVPEGLSDPVLVNVATSLLQQAEGQRIRDAIWEQLRRAQANGEAEKEQLVTSFLTNVLEATDHKTSEHCKKVALYAYEIAEKSGLDHSDKVRIQLAARLHDVGKIAIPGLILNKPGPLSPDEKLVIRQHPVYAEAVVMAAGELLAKIGPMVRHHHEWYNGYGYPDRISKPPVEVAIISIADAFDSMTSDHPYRSAMPLDQALEELKRFAGSQFDPDVVDTAREWLAGFDNADWQGHSNERRAKALWLNYTGTRGGTSKSELIAHYSSFVKRIAGRMIGGLPSQVDFDDLVSFGMFGLMQAIDRFEPERGFKFETFAEPRVRGAIIDGLRREGLLTRNARPRELSYDSYANRVVSIHEVEEHGRIYGQRCNSEPEPLHQGFDEEYTGDPEVYAEQKEFRDELVESINRLPKVERLVVELYYFEDKSLKEIGNIVGVTEARISQIKKQALERLKSELRVGM